MLIEKQSELIVYADESGDHGPVSAEFPVLVLVFCVFEKKLYAERVTTLLHRFKFKHFGHDAVVMHERDIRKSKNAFRFLQVAERRQAFMADMNTLIEAAPFTLITAVIDKRRLAAKYAVPKNPYHLAMTFGLERIEMFRRDRGDDGKLHIIFEGRGKTENDDLELEFRRTCSSNLTGKKLDFEPHFAKKEEGHCGHQIADLIARPIGRHHLDPDQPNRAFEIIEKKLRRSSGGKVDGWGLKTFP